MHSGDFEIFNSKLRGGRNSRKWFKQGISFIFFSKEPDIGNPKADTLTMNQTYFIKEQNRTEQATKCVKSIVYHLAIEVVVYQVYGGTIYYYYE